MNVRPIISLLLLFSSCLLFTQNIIKDLDGNEYPIVKIGNQYWTTKNLETRHYSDGSEIPSYCYDNDTLNCIKYGRLYSWTSLIGGSKSDSLSNVCPEGWHIPSFEDWKSLFDTLGGPVSAGVTLRRSKKLNFNFQWGGNYHSDLDVFSFVGRKVYYWSSTAYSKNTAWMVMTGINIKNMNVSTVPKEYSFSIRCVKTEREN